MGSREDAPRSLTIWCPYCLPGRPCFVHEPNDYSPPPASDAAGIEAALAAGLAAHRLIHDDRRRDPFRCTCDKWVAVVAANGRDREGVTIEDQHRAHQAAALLPVVTQAQAAERERVAQAIEAEASRMHAAFAAEEDAHLADMKNRLGVDLEPGHWNRHDDGCGMCGMSSAARIARAAARVTPDNEVNE